MAQNTQTEKMNIDVIEHYTSLNKNILSGEIHIKVNDMMRKNHSAQYQILFCKVTSIKHLEPIVQYNILSIKDSIQYIFNQHTWFVINHKKKTYSVENKESWCKISCLFPYLWPEILLDNMSSYYLQEKLFVTKHEILSADETPAVFSLIRQICFPAHQNITRITQTYIWDKETSLLSKSRMQIMEYKRKDISKVISDKETTLLKASFNKEEYSNFNLYDGAHYIQTWYKQTN